MTAIRATYSDLKLVKTRKVLQLIFEVPIEEADNALRVLGGMPRADAETWVGIAPITEEAAQRVAPGAVAAKPRKAWGDLTPTQQAGIRCSDVDFQAWLGCFDAEEAAVKVRDHCGVKSRSDIGLHPASKRWRQMDNDFLERNIG